MSDTPVVSVIIPVLHEGASINACVAHVKSLAREGGVEIVVADGAGDTLEALRDSEVVRVRAPRGRARQMNAGARAATGRVLLFLHADTRLPPNGLRLAARAVAPGSGTAAGAFGLALDTQSALLRLFARGANLRNRLARTPYGDQAHFFRATTFHAMGGYPELPIMEDVEIMRRLRRAGQPIALLPESVRTSARRYAALGAWRCAVRNNVLRALYGLGVPARWLARWYRPQGEEPGRAAILFFVRRPVPGRVKTRLAKAVGAEAAAELYTAFVRDMADALARAGAALRVCVAPEEREGEGGGEDALQALRELLGPEHDYAPQRGADVGERMRRAFEEAFAQGFERAICIGSDIPDLPGEVARQGLDALRGAGAVLGPAEDGGYYCIGFASSAFVPQAFEGIAWSTPGVCEATREALKKAGLRPATLPSWRDVDTLDDARALHARGRGTDFERSRTWTLLDRLLAELDSRDFG